MVIARIMLAGNEKLLDLVMKKGANMKSLKLAKTEKYKKPLIVLSYVLLRRKLMFIKSTLQIIFIVLMICLTEGAVFGQATAFNYQGKLTDGGSPANGNYQFQFKLFDALSGGAQIGSTISDISITVVNGVFGVKLDFGANALTGANRWLEISVRRNSSETYITLSPREQIASSPYSVRTLSAASADVATNALNLGGIAANEYVTTSSVGSTFIRNATAQQTANFNISGNGFFGGNIGIGTLSPQSRLSILTPINNYGFTHTDGNVTIGSFIGTGTGWFGTRSNHSLNFFTNNGSARMTIDPIGNVAIGSSGITTAARLYLDGGPSWTSGFWQHSLAFTTASAIGWTANSSGQKFAIGQTTGGLYFFRTNADFGSTVSAPNYDMIINDAGNVGVGTTTPQAKLQIAGTGANGFTLGVEGNVTQNLDKGGFVKAMVFVLANGTIARCYNGITGSSTGNCGFSVSASGGFYTVNFGFSVLGRFFSVIPNGTDTSDTAVKILGVNANGTLSLRTFDTNNTSVGENVVSDFYLIVY